jgi:(2Fe-2S) ferredoxin
MAFYRSHVLVCADPECLSKGAHEVVDALQDEFIAQGLLDEIQVLETSRIGGCANGPEMMVYPEGVHYVGMTPDDIPYLVEEHFLKGRIVDRFREIVKPIVDEELGPLRPKEVRVVLRNCGQIDPNNIEDYLATDGYQALGKVTVRDDSGAGHRRSHGVPACAGAAARASQPPRSGKITRDVQDSPKYMICNADEGDPGAFMNRRVLEGDPHSVIEGMIIGAYAVGASYGYIYCRAEYPIAVETLNIAIAQAREFGFLGNNILGTDFSFDLEVRVGAGAFVCGEETALIASIMGMRGEPHPRPPFPSVKGVWDKPSNNNNVETYSNVPQIILNGAAWYASMGTENPRAPRPSRSAAMSSSQG